MSVPSCACVMLWTIVRPRPTHAWSRRTRSLPRRNGSAEPHAAHVAIVVRDVPGQQGPDVINGDGNLTAFSAVETGGDQRGIEVGHKHYPLTGYVSPPS